MVRVSRRLFFVLAPALLIACTPTVEQAAEPEPTLPPKPKPTAAPLRLDPVLARKPQPIEPIVAAPAKISLPTLKVEAPVKEVGLDTNGEMVTPKDAETVVWYGGSPPPGLVGNSILAGHTDWEGKLGSFNRIGRLEPGDEVMVQAADGVKRTFKVEWKESLDRTTTALHDVFGPTAKPAITLITCGGIFNQVLRDYSHRIVVRAIAT